MRLVSHWHKVMMKMRWPSVFWRIRHCAVLQSVCLSAGCRQASAEKRCLPEKLQRSCGCSSRSCRPKPARQILKIRQRWAKRLKRLLRNIFVIRRAAQHCKGRFPIPRMRCRCWTQCSGLRRVFRRQLRIVKQRVRFLENSCAFRPPVWKSFINARFSTFANTAWVRSQGGRQK